MKEKHNYTKLDAFYGMDVIWLLNQWVEKQPDKTFVIWAPNWKAK